MLPAVSRCDFYVKNAEISRISYVKIADQKLRDLPMKPTTPVLFSHLGHAGHSTPFGRLRFPRVPRFLFCFLICKQITVIWLHKAKPFKECNEKEALERKTVCVRDGPDAQRLTGLRWPRFTFWGLFLKIYLYFRNQVQPNSLFPIQKTWTNMACPDIDVP